MLQYLNPRFVAGLKKNFPWYVIIVLAGVVIFLDRRVTMLVSENKELYKNNAKKDSIIIAKTGAELAVYQKFMLGMNELLFMQKFQIEKTDTIISRVTKTN